MTEYSRFNGDALLWNWARWCWLGETVGNMSRYIPQEEDSRPIIIEHAQAVQVLYERLPKYHAMVILAEYPKKNVWFGKLSEDARRTMAMRWIRSVTGAILRREDYARLLDQFIDEVEKEVLI